MILPPKLEFLIDKITCHFSYSNELTRFNNAKNIKKNLKNK